MTDKSTPDKQTELATVNVHDTDSQKLHQDAAPQKPGGRGRPAPSETVSYSKLLRYATHTDRLMMLVGIICAAANGSVMPIYAILLGSVFNALAGRNPFNDVLPYALGLFGLGVGAFIVSTIAYSSWSMSSQKQVKIIREQYLISVMRQEIGWWDSQSPGELSSRLAVDSDMIEAAIGTSVPAVVQHLSRFTTGMIVGFVYGWQLALVIIGVSPILMITGAMMGKLMATMAGQSSKAYGQAGAVAEEAITSMRTVAAFNAEKQELNRFDKRLKEALIAGEKRSKATGFLFGTILFVMFATYALAFWFGAQLIALGTTNARTGKPFTGGDVLSTFFGMLMGSFSLGQLAPYVPDFTNGKAAGFRLFQVIDRQSKIDPTQEKERLPSVHGDIEFKDVKFAYPTRSDVPILKGVTFKISSGQTVALVGESGSGKSTVIGLLERFYNPDEGTILVDGNHDITSLSVRWWRQNVGLVGQMPLLFQGTIKENIKYGNHNATDEEVINASKLANAHAFIETLPDKYDTRLGGFGSEFLSGGQKQRIAIARALVKKPKILLLDEATSALDNESEKIVQKAIDELMNSKEGKEMTCLVIAHRLSTIRNADKILVFSKGAIVEEGSHDTLIGIEGGTYRNLVMTQAAAAAQEEKKEDPLPSTEEIMTNPRSPKSTRMPKSPRRRASFSKSKQQQEPSKSQQHIPIDFPVESVAKAHTDDDDDQDDGKGEEEGLKAEEEDEDNTPVPYQFLWSSMRPYLLWVVVGVLASMGAGAVQPAFGIIMSGMITIFYDRNIDTLKRESATYAIYFLIIAIGNFLMLFFQSFGLGMVGERMTSDLRHEAFRSILRQEISFFDHSKNSAGVLATRISVDAEQVRKITTDWTGQLIQITICAGGGMLIAYITNWKLALLLTGCAPLIVFAGLGQTMFMKSKGAKKAFELAGSMASEAIAGVHTVVSFTAEEIILKRFSEQLEVPLRDGIRAGFITGAAMGGSEMLLFIAFGSALLFGSWLILQKLATFAEVTRVFFSVVLSFQNIGRIAERLPDIEKSSKAVRAIYNLITRRSAIDHEAQGGDDVNPENTQIVLRDVRFRYPSRPEAVVLENLSLEIPSGKTTALVGFSGSGKSTVIQLLERYYDPESGMVEVNKQNLANLNVKNWRSIIGYVGQEPVLFNLTIKENILYGRPTASEEEILDAARRANVMEFVSKLSQGLDTPVGSRGGQLSGGQRQRVAIARAILRDPKILLLDEATSALDNESERLIQEALDKLMKGRTTIVIAHRLSTIQNADLIVVMSSGRVVEKGTHEELLHRAGGVYAGLVAAGAGSAKH